MNQEERSMNTLFRLLVVPSLFCFVQIASSQTTANPDSALQTILASLGGTRLTLQQAVEHALTNATSVRSAEAVYAAAEGSVRRERGRFDPELFLSVNHLDNQQPTSSAFAGAPILATKQTLSRGGLRMNLPIGTQVELSMNATRLTTNSALATLNPEYDATGLLTLRQPLLSGFMSSSRKQLSSAEEQLDAEKARYDQATLGVRADVERMYWDLYAAERDYAVQRLTRDRAREFMKETQLRQETGLVGSGQVASARTFLAQQELALFDREEQLGHQSDLLATLIGVQPPDTTLRFVPIDTPPSEFALEPIEVMVERALKNNLDLQATQRDVEAVRTLADAAKWEALPSVDLIGSVGGNGLLGTSQVVAIPGFPAFTGPNGSFGDALNQAIKRDYPSWSIGVEVSVPIGLRSGLGEKDRLEAQVTGAQQRSIEYSRQLEQQVRAAYREVSHGKGRIQAAKSGVEAAEEQVRIGLIEFRTGRVTAFELVRLGEDFATAQQRYSDALVRTAKAAATLKQLTSDESIKTNPR
jgi:outer membrane protein TolC